MTGRASLPGGRRTPFVNNALWLLAAIFGIATVWAGVRLVHDDRGVIVRMAARDKALVIATLVVAIVSSRREVRLAEARSNFVAGVSHDLRMPLAQILLAGETMSLGRDQGDAHRHRLAASVVREARRLMALVDNVLLFA